MRILFLLLVLLNLGYFAWQWQQRSEAPPPQSGPIAVAPGAPTLTLLSEARTVGDAAATPRNNALQETPPAAPAAPNP